MIDKLSSNKLKIEIRRLLSSGSYVVTQHGASRMIERGFGIHDVTSVLRSGYHDAQYDVWDIKFKAWKYAISGSTQDGRSLRIIVALKERCIIITVIDTGAEREKKKNL